MPSRVLDKVPGPTQVDVLSGIMLTCQCLTKSTALRELNSTNAPCGLTSESKGHPETGFIPAGSLSYRSFSRAFKTSALTRVHFRFGARRGIIV